ncbi:MAG: type I methionyl aminopeptidase [Lentisphaeria bacterium]
MSKGSREARFIVHPPAAVAHIREAARVTGEILAELTRQIQPGMTTLLLDQLAGQLIRRCGGESAFFNYHGFPGQICISVNDEVVHGIGRADRVLMAGDLVGLDVGVRLKGAVGDTATTVCVGGRPAPVAARLMEATRRSLDAGIAAARGGDDLSVIGKAIETVIKAAGFSVVRDFVGHGCGRELHEPPEVPNFTTTPRGILLRPGMVLAIEPMVNAGGWRVTVDKHDGWTVRTADGSLSTHYEHMVLITQGEAEVLTCPKTPSE